ncbi:c-type cytochrome [Paenibacillus harenae]|uniref:c-type cytochrome n=1 Tax=Paenibacillus harenae TaxID=306543 RepID=UPI0003FA8FEC|nr:cytochrome c [Paenibacillus harenae]
MNRRKWLLWTAVIVLAAMLSACGGNNANNGNVTNGANETNGANGTNGTDGTNGNTQPDNGGNAVSAAEAESLYSQNCVSCHAVDLSGGGGPDLRKVGSEMSAEEIHAQISNGGSGMPAYKGQLAEEQIAALTEWLAGHK